VAQVGDGIARTGEGARVDGRGAVLALAMLVLAGCGGGLTPTPRPVQAPTPVADAPTPVAPMARAVRLPVRLGPTTWRVRTVTRLATTGASGRTEEQRLDSRALVSWSFARTAAGALRGTGQVDSFTVRSTLDTTTTSSRSAATTPALASLLLIEAVLDSVTSRVIIRPPLANECDRPEASAASLARELLVRVPDGAVAGDRWRDSTITLVCRSGVPMNVFTVIRSTLEQVTDEQLVVVRDVTTRLEGKGGSTFRALELTGTGTGRQRVELRTSDGSVSAIDGASTMTLQLRESAPPSPPRVQQLVQRVELRVERVSR
jgi:hypothetical protein